MKKFLLASALFFTILLVPHGAKAAIAFSTATASSANGVTSLTFSHTAASTATALFVGITGTQDSDVISTVTYAGFSLFRSTALFVSSHRYLYLYYISTPTAGVNNVVISASASGFIGAVAASYTGSSQTSQPEAFGFNSNSAVTVLTATVTVATQNAWVVGVGKHRQGSIIAGSSTTMRVNDGFGGGITGWFDKNGPVSTGQINLALNTSAGSGEAGWIVASLAPATAVSSSFVLDLSTIPKSHTNPIIVYATGTSTSWQQNITTFSVSGVTGTSLSTYTITSSTNAILRLVTGSGTGVLSVTDQVSTSTIFVGTPSFTVTPNAGMTNSSYTLTMNGSSTVWRQEYSTGLFTISGGYQSVLSSITVQTHYVSTATLYAGTSPATITILDVPSGSSATFTVVTATIGISSPVRYQLFQRDWNRTNQADIYITGAYSGTPTSIEASWSTGTYQTISSTPSGGTYQGKLLRQATGCGPLSVRFTNDTSISTATHNICIGDAYVVMGESHPSGRFSSNQSYTGPTNMAVMFGNDYVWKPLADPTDSSSGQLDTVSSDASAAGTIWPIVASSITIHQNVPVAFIPCAKGATTIGDWAPGSNHYNRSTLYGSMVNRSTVSASHGIRAVLYWMQDNDIVIPTSSATYISRFVNFSTNTWTDVRAPVVVFVGNSSSNETDADEAAIRNALYQLWERDQNTARGPDFFAAGLADDDGVHMTTTAKAVSAATLTYEAMKLLFYTNPTVGFTSSQ